MKSSVLFHFVKPLQTRAGTNSLFFDPDRIGFFCFKFDGSGSTVGWGSNAPFQRSSQADEAEIERRETNMSYIHLVLSVLLLAGAVVDVTAQSAPSDNLLNFLSVLPGDFSNQKQIDINGATGENHPPMSASFKPVDVPALSPSITFLLEEVVNRADIRLQLLVVSEQNGGIIRLQKYNLPGHYSPGTFDLNQLNDLKASDLNTNAKCDVLYEAVDPTVFLGTWPDCHDMGAKNVPRNYVTLMTCTALAFHAPNGAAETSVRLPNDFDRVKKYDLLPYMVGDRQDFVDPCSN